MATYDPPLQTLPIFDSSVFINGADGLSTTEADARYLRFPSSQGSETINGTLTSTSLITQNLNATGTNSLTIGNASATTQSVSLCGILEINGAGANSTKIGNSAGSFITMANDILTQQATYPPDKTTQLGYTIQKTFGPANVSDTTGTYSNIGSQALPAVKGVYIITCGFTITASGNDTLENISILLSLTSGTSGVVVNAYGAWRYFNETDDTMGGGGSQLRYVGMLGGTYINSTGSAATLYLNGYGKTTSTETISVQGNCSITRVG